MFGRRNVDLDFEHYKGPGLLKGGKNNSCSINQQREELIMEDELAETLSGEKTPKNKKTKLPKFNKTKQPGFFRRLFIDKRTLAIWDELPAGAKRAESAKGIAIGLAALLAAGFAITILEDKFGIIHSLSRKAQKNNNIESEPFVIPVTDSSANKADTAAAVTPDSTTNKTDTAAVATDNTKTETEGAEAKTEITAERITRTGLPAGLNPGSYEYLREDGSRTGIYNAHAVELPIREDIYTIKKGDTLWGIVNKELKKQLGNEFATLGEAELEALRRTCMQAVCEDKSNPEYLDWKPGKCCQRLDIGDTVSLKAVKDVLEKNSKKLDEVA